MKHFFFMVVFLMTCLLQQAVAQDKSVSGRVTEGSNGQGLPGVTVLVKGTKIGTATNAEGQFTLSVPASTTTLIFSSVGFKSTERDVTSASTVDVAMAVETRSLDEVVVTGLASSVKRSNLANAITTISAKELIGSTRPVTVDAALSGKIVGANIAQTSGAPGGGVSVQLRGISTLNGTAQPLYIIDGVYAINSDFGNGAGSAAFSGASGGVGRTTQDNGINRLSDINPNDIESIEVLKGPSAAAIYGTRANAGVILIRTKRGAAGQTRVSFTQDLGMAKAWRLLGKSDWTNEKIDYFFAPGASNTAEKAALAAAQAAGGVNDYEKEIFGNTAFLRNTGLSVSGGSERTKFYVSGSTSNEEGIVRRTGFQRHSVRANLDQKIGDRIDLGVSSNYISSRNQRGFTGNDNNGISLAYTLAYTPSYAQLRPDALGRFPDNPYGGDNPLAVVERTVNDERTNRFVQSANTTVRLLDTERSSLRITAQGGIDFSSSDAQLAIPSDMQSQQALALPGAARVAKNQFFNSNVQGFLIYDWKLGSNVSLTSQVGTVRLSQNSNLTYNQGQNLSPGPPYTPNRGTVATQETDLRREQDVGIVAQQEVNFSDQVIGTAGIRFDKSSRNGLQDKFYAFPKASLAVNVAKFDFWSLDQVNLVKLRVAYGETGGPAFYNVLYSPLIPISTGGRPGLLPSVLIGNPDIKPERATELEAGIDLGFLGGRIGLEASVYNKEVIDLVDTYALAPATGLSSVRGYNIGDIRNRGLELALTVVPVRSTFFTWSSTTQFWLNRTEVTKLNSNPTVPPFNTGLGFGGTFGRNIFTVGESPSRWYGSPGSPSSPRSNTFSGLTRYEEAQPTFQMSFLNNFTVAKNVEVSFLLHWKKDGYVSNLSQLLQDEGGTTKDWSTPSPVVNSDGEKAEVVGIARQTTFSTARQYIQNAGYLRLREASIYYTLPTELRTSMFKDYVKNLRIGVSGNNLLTFTDYVGYDPEVSNFGATGNFAQVDVGSYPNSRRFWFHLGIDF